MTQLLNRTAFYFAVGELVTWYTALRVDSSLESRGHHASIVVLTPSE